MAAFRQTSFIGGEVAPGFHGRTDMEKYHHALKRARNFYVSPTGQLLSRPGTLYQGTAHVPGSAVRLIPFIYSDGEAYVLEFGHLYVRMWHNQNGLVTGLNGGADAHLVTPYTAAQLPYLKHAQVGDVVTLAHRDHALRTLSRGGATTWTLATVTLDRTELNIGSKQDWRVQDPLNTPDADHPEVEWTYLVTHIARNETDGLLWESLPFEVVSSVTMPGGTPVTALPSKLAVYPDMPLTLVAREVNGLISDPGYEVLAYRFYRGSGDRFGWIGDAKAFFNTSGSLTFIDLGKEPDYSRGPPQGYNPFAIYDYEETLLRTEDPSAVTYFEGRRILAGTVERPAYLWGSRVDDWANFDWTNSDPPPADDSYEFELASRKRVEIRSLLGLERLIIFTDSAVWTAGGAGGDPLSPATLPDVRVVEEIGASWLDPISVSDAVLYVRTKGTGVREVLFTPGAARVRGPGRNLSILAPHLFEGYSVVDWTYQEDPHSVIWAARSDGKLLSLTYVPEHDVWAWTWHDTDGTVESVCAIPSSDGTEDSVWMLVKRNIDGSDTRYLERLATRQVGDIDDYVGLDSAIDVTPIGGGNSVSGLTHLEGETVYALVDGVPAGPYTVASGVIDYGSATAGLHFIIGLKYLPEAETLDLAAAREKAKVVRQVTVEVEASRGLQVGEDSDTLEDWTPSSAGLQTDRALVRIASTWNLFGRVFIRQDSPLPLTILGITREAEAGSL